MKDHDQELYQLEDDLRDILSPYVVKTPSNEDTKQLLSSLQYEFSKLQHEDEDEEFVVERPNLLTQFRSQLSFYRWYFWIASIGIFTMLTLFTTSMNSGSAETVFLFTIPLSIILGTFYTYQSWNKEMRIVESVTPFPPALLFLTRLLIILAMNVLLGLVSSIFVGVSLHEITMGSFLLYWLAPTFIVFGVFAFIFLMKGMKLAFGTATSVWLALFIGELYVRNELQFIYPSIMEYVLLLQFGLFAVGVVLIILSVKRSYRVQIVQS